MPRYSLAALEPQGLVGLCESAPLLGDRGSLRRDVDPAACDAGCVRAECRYGRCPQNVEDTGGRHHGEPDGSRAQRPVAHPAFRPESPGPGACPDSGSRPAPRSFGRCPRTRRQGSTGRHLHPGRFFRPDYGPSQRHRLHRCTHRTPVPRAARRSRLHFVRRTARRRAGRRRLCRGGEYPHRAAAAHLPALRGFGRPVRLCLCQPLGSGDLGPFFGARGGLLPPQRRLPAQHRFLELQRFRACDLRRRAGRVLRPASRVAGPRFRLQRLLCGLQPRPMGAHRDGAGVAAVAEDRRPLLAGSRRELPQEFRPL